MPSPLAHMLGGLAAGWLVAGRDRAAPPAPPSALRDGVPGWWRRAFAFAAIGGAPDLDLLFDTHSTYTHSVAAVVLTAAAVLAWTRGRQLRLALAFAAAVASHVLLDWLGTDTSAPIGVMALWPLTRAHYQSPVVVFDAISRRWWMPGFYAQNGRAVLREVAILVPIVVLVGWIRTRGAEGPPRGRSAHAGNRRRLAD